jgi:hypothetical protein
MKQLLVTGCSFSAGSTNTQEALNAPSTWGHFLLKSLGLPVFVNLSISGGGNYAAGKNLIYWIENDQHITPENTLIVFNLTGLDRIDTMCPPDHPNANKFFSWSHVFKFGWITQGSFLSTQEPFKGLLQKNMGYNQVQISSSLAIIDTITYIESKNLDYRFMVMDQQILDESPVWLTKFISDRSTKWIKFDGCQTMHEYCKKNNMLAHDQFHPSLDGHKEIASYIYQAI